MRDEDVEALSRRYGPMVLRRCRRLLGDDDAALDACQDVFVRVLEHRSRLDARYPSSLLYRIATNVCLNRIRDSRRNPVSSDEAVLYEIARAEEPGATSEARLLLARLFGRHPESSRTIGVLHFVDGLKVELGVEPGSNEIRLEREKTSMMAKTHVDDGRTFVLDGKQFGPVALEATRRRGGPSSQSPSSPFAVAGRHRVDVVLGGSHVTQAVPSDLSASGSINAFGGVQYTIFPRENLGLTFAVIARRAQRAFLSTEGFSSSFSASPLVTVPVGVRWNPFTAQHPASQLKPFLGASIGPVFGSGSTSVRVPGGTTNGSGSYSATTVGGDALAGVDFLVARSFSLSVSGGYNWMGSLNRPIGARDNYSGVEFGIGFGFLFGKGR